MPVFNRVELVVPYIVALGYTLFCIKYPLLLLLCKLYLLKR